MFKVYYNDISIIRGDTGFFAINICNSNGESVSLADDDVLIKWEPHTRDFSRELGDQTSQRI